MALQTTQTLASILARGAGLGIRKAESIEEAEERRLGLARSVKSIERQRTAERRTGLGRLLGGGAGGLLGFLVGGPAGASIGTGLGSGAGQWLATRDVARERLAPIGVGAFQVGRGREREAEFGLGERAFGETLSADILGNALKDALSAMAFQNLLQGRGGGLFGAPREIPINPFEAFA